MVGAAIISRLAPPMSAAIDALPDTGARRTALWQLRVIRAAVPLFSRTLEDETVFTQLYMGDALPSSVRASVDPRARGVMSDGLHDATWWQRLAFRDGWRDVRAAQDALVAAADLPDAERAAAFEAAAARLRSSPFAAINLPDYLRYSRRADAATRRLDALLLVAAACTFRGERGRWPASVAEVEAAGDLDGAEARLAGAALLHQANALLVRVPLPQVDEKGPSDLVLIVRGPQAGRD
jgi:hypothetical protein